MHSATVIFAVWILAGCSSASAAGVRYVGFDLAQRAPRFDESIDAVSQALRIPALRQVKLPEGAREVRIWTGFNVVPGYLLRMVEMNGRTTGELARWWGEDSMGDSARQEEFVELMRTSGCGRIVRARLVDEYQVEACRVTGSEALDWPAMLRQVDSLAIWSLPDPLPSTDTVLVVRTFHGVSMVVELRSGGSYRTHASQDSEEPIWRQQILEELLNRAGRVVSEFLRTRGHIP
jgi:hypothetical protein